jgi:heat shock protein HspQ
MQLGEARFAVGQVVRHRMFGYRGVIFDVDPECRASEAWYEQMALSRPPRDRPWYHVLVHDAQHTTYVAERNLEIDDSGEPIRHPMLDDYFEAMHEGHYVTRRGTLS